MKYLVIFILSLLITLTYLMISSIDTQLRVSNDLARQELEIRQKDLVLHEIDTIASFCDSRSGSIEYDKDKGLDCNDKKPTPSAIKPKLDPDAAIIEL